MVKSHWGVHSTYSNRVEYVREFYTEAASAIIFVTIEFKIFPKILSVRNRTGQPGDLIKS